MRFGFPFPAIQDRSLNSPYSKAFDLCLLAEDLGFDFCTIGHRSFTPDSTAYSAPLTVLSALAALTSKIRLVTGIYILPLHHPVVVGEQLATLDEISGGRTVFGVGVGYRDYEFKAFGVELSSRGARTDEAMKIIRSAFTKGNWQYEGRFWTLDDLPLHPAPLQENGPQMWVGGIADAALHRAARFGDGWMSDNMLDLEAEAERATFYRDACAQEGREPGEVCILRSFWAAPTRQEAEDVFMPRMREYLAHYGSADAGSGTLPWDSPLMTRVAGGEHVPVNEFARNQALVGTPDDINAELERWQDRIAPDSVTLMPTGPLDYDAMRATLELFGKHVLPNFS